jgi:hypothetical protein
MSRKPARHRVTVAKRNLYGSRLWWATCTCRRFYQGCHEKQEAQRMAAEHMTRQKEA